MAEKIDDWLEAQRINGGPHGFECIGIARMQQVWDAAQEGMREYSDQLRQQLAAEIMRLEIALRIKTEEHKCCSEDLMKLRESEQSGWKEAAIAWEVCGSIHEAFAKKKDALYSTRHSDFERHAEDARRMLSTESKEKVE